MKNYLLIMTTGMRVRLATLSTVFVLMIQANGEAHGHTLNQAPETNITSGPDNLSLTPHHLTFAFSGADPDGSVDHYDYILLPQARRVATIQDIVFVYPTPSDPRWQSVHDTHIDLIALADTLHADPRTLVGPAILDRWQTFFVRAVDNLGTPDPTPDFRVFDAYTLAPRVWFRPPVVPGQILETYTFFAQSLSAIDQVGLNGPTGTVVATRTLLIPCPTDSLGQPENVLDALYNTNYPWQPWRPWASPDSSARTVYFGSLFPGRFYILAVQGIDDGGAITPQFSSEPGSNNYVVLRCQHVSDSNQIGDGATALLQNYPNPFYPRTTIRFALPRRQDVLIQVFDVRGRRLRTLLNEQRNVGMQNVEWDGTDETGALVPGGVYFYRLTVGTRSTTKKMALLKK